MPLFFAFVKMKSKLFRMFCLLFIVFAPNIFAQSLRVPYYEFQDGEELLFVQVVGFLKVSEFLLIIYGRLNLNSKFRSGDMAIGPRQRPIQMIHIRRALGQMDGEN